MLVFNPGRCASPRRSARGEGGATAATPGLATVRAGSLHAMYGPRARQARARSDRTGGGEARQMRQARACAFSPARVVPVPEARLARPLALAGGPPAVPVLLVRAANPVRAGGISPASGHRARGQRSGGPDLDAGALWQYSAQPWNEGGRYRGPCLGRGAGLRGEPPRAHGRSGSDPQSPREGVEGRQEPVARAERSGAGAFRYAPVGGGSVRQGAASVRARCRADGGPERRLAAQREAGAVRWRQSGSRCTDRSADRCADRCTFMTARARAWGGLDAAEAAPRLCALWRSRG